MQTRTFITGFYCILYEGTLTERLKQLLPLRRKERVVTKFCSLKARHFRRAQLISSSSEIEAVIKKIHGQGDNLLGYGLWELSMI